MWCSRFFISKGLIVPSSLRIKLWDSSIYKKGVPLRLLVILFNFSPHLDTIFSKSVSAICDDDFTPLRLLLFLHFFVNIIFVLWDSLGKSIDFLIFIFSWRRKKVTKDEMRRIHTFSKNGIQPSAPEAEEWTSLRQQSFTMSDVNFKFSER